jgi:hypothetical protein
VAAGGVEGPQVQVVSFFEMVGEVPAWFQLAADSQGLVTEVAMRAQGHFMEHRYDEFDAPLAVRPPAAEG